MDVAAYPTAGLRLTEPIALGTVPVLASKVRYTATGDLDMHGVSRTVTFPLTAERTAGGIYALADIHVVFAGWNILNPSIGGLVTTHSTGTLEVLVEPTKGAGNPARSGTGAPAAGAGGPVTVPSTTVPKLSIPSG